MVIPQLLRQFDVEPAEVLAAAGLNLDALDSSESTIPYAAMGRLAEVAAHRTGCAHIGLLIGKHINTATLGLVGELMRNAPTLGDALRDFAANQHRNAHGSVVYLLTEGDRAFFGYAVYHPGVPGNSVICDGAAAAAFNLVRELTPHGSTATMGMMLSRPEPDDSHPYALIFGVNLHFSSDQTAAFFPRAFLNEPVPGSDPHRRDVLKTRVAGHWPSGELDVVTQVRRALRVGLLGKRFTGEEIAADLNMSRRTLHRRLRESNFNFQQILEETRCEFAQQLLRASGLAVGTVGNMIGYSDPPVFTRAFSRWTGMTPREWRSNSMGASAGLVRT